MRTMVYWVMTGALFVLAPAGSAQCTSDDTIIWGVYYPITRLNGNNVRGYSETTITGPYRTYWQPAITGTMYRDSYNIGTIGELGPGPAGGTQPVTATATLQTWGPGTYSLRAFHRAYNWVCMYWVPPYSNGWQGYTYSYPNLTVQRPARPDYYPGANRFLWYLGGMAWSGQYSAQTVFTPGDPNGAPESPVWVISEGATKLYLSCTNCWYPNVTATNNSDLCQSYDVVVRTSYNGFLSDPFCIFINTPWSTVAAPDPLPACGGTWVCSSPYYDGYYTRINYKTLSLCSLDPPMTAYDLNEQFGTWYLTDPSYNWLHGPAIGGYVAAAPVWRDNVNFWSAPGNCTTLPCVPAPANPWQGQHDLVQYVLQRWFVGGQDPGVGALIQMNTLQRYRDEAWHDQITTPAR